MGPEPGGDKVLRAKYLDWCSAKVAERFLRLTPEEIYELAQRASRREQGAADDVTRAVALPGADGGEAPPFRRIVEQLTESVTAELDLPPFEAWAKSYADDPAQYDEDLLGLWRERLG